MTARLALRIEGSGIAAAALAELSRRRGDVFALVPTRPSISRIVALDPVTVGLLSDVFERDVAALVPARWVERRAVAWERREFDHVNAPALVCDAAALAAALMPACAGAIDNESAFIADCAVFSARRSVIYEGRRRAATAMTEPPPGFEMECSYVAATPAGWIHAVAGPEGGVAVTGVFPLPSADLEACFAESLYSVWPSSALRLSNIAEGPRVPRLAEDAAGNCLLVGDAALALDPLRGDGVGYAVRGAILAHAVLGAIASGADAAACFGHYRARLGNVFRDHLANTARHYERAWNHGIWREDVALMHAWRERAPKAEMGYRLEVA